MWQGLKCARTAGAKSCKKKTKILHVRGTEKVEKIGEYTLEDEVKYLGVYI